MVPNLALRRYCMLLCFFGLVPVHASPLPGADPQAGELTALLSQVSTVIGGAPCNENAQCHTVPVGIKACGGPEFYLAWSTQQTSGKQLDEVVARYNTARRAQLTARGEISNCRFMSDPGALCQINQATQSGQCILRPADRREE